MLIIVLVMACVLNRIEWSSCDLEFRMSFFLHSKAKKKKTMRISFWDLMHILFFFLLRPVGMPKMEKVYLHNPSSEEISLISISATTAHFHASFFQSRVSTCLGYDLLKSVGHTHTHNREALMSACFVEQMG